MTPESYLLDTNVISEVAKPRPNVGVSSWLEEVDEDTVHVSVVTLAELRFGIERMEDGRRRRRLETWLRDDVTSRFGRRIVEVDIEIAQAWGVVLARGQARGLTVGAMEGFIAATAQARGLTLVTRNVRDFEQLGLPLLDPWVD